VTKEGIYGEIEGKIGENHEIYHKFQVPEPVQQKLVL
jgi:hypothetical protein